MPGQGSAGMRGRRRRSSCWGDYRTSRYNWWAVHGHQDGIFYCYDNLPAARRLAAYAAELGVDAETLVERDFSAGDGRECAGQSGQLPQHESFRCGAPLDRGRAGARSSDYVHIAVERINAFFRRQFFFDGQWRECSVSYNHK